MTGCSAEAVFRRVRQAHRGARLDGRCRLAPHGPAQGPASEL